MYALGVTLIKIFVDWWPEIHCSRLQNVETIVNTRIPAGPGTGDAVLTARTVLVRAVV